MVTHSKPGRNPTHHQWSPHVFQRHGRPLGLIHVAITLLAIVTSSVTLAQDDQNPSDAVTAETAVATEPTETADVTEPVREIEQINVIGERSLLTMRNQIIREEESLYKMFNDLNSADKFDITCKTERLTRSYIPVRSCEPAFLGAVRRAANRDALTEMRSAFSSDGVDSMLLINGMDRMQSDSELTPQLASDYAALQQEMLRLAQEHPEYLASLQRIAELKQQYQAAREERFGKD